MPWATELETTRRRISREWRTKRQRLRTTIAGGCIESVFQPIVELREGRTFGLEALSRPLGGCAFSNAGELFEAAEQLGMLWPLERLTRAVTLGGLAGWPSGVRLFLNCSPSVIMDDRFMSEISAALRVTPELSPADIVLEITERCAGGLLPGLPERVQSLRARGFDIAIDDVGAGASGLNQISSIRPNWLKLDRLLMADIDTDRFRQSLVAAIVRFAHENGIRVVAEGIERPEELETVTDLGVGYAQGYLLGRPGPLAAGAVDGLKARNPWRDDWDPARRHGKSV
ncbi:MAG: EAL domain-containing protein [Planctomycetes bacterium]|nr:EAL domain-containing protein [Planctomycetota bacterium]